MAIVGNARESKGYVVGEPDKYEIKGKTVTIHAISRASVKIKDSFYTVEWGEDRTIPDTDDVNMAAERKALWDTVNNECDGAIEEIIKTFNQ